MTSFLMAVCNRTSLGVAAEEATERFSIGPAQLSLFVIVQVAVYASMQIPVGAILDRVGTRWMVVTGMILMSIGQSGLAFSLSVEQVLGARVLVGLGDSMIFISLTRLVPAWFSPRHVPVVTQLTAQVGQLGQILSAVPLLIILHRAGWAPAYLSAAALTVMCAVLIAIVVRDRQPGVPKSTAGASARQILGDLKTAAGTLGTQLGFWSHFSVQYSSMVFLLVWGFPFITLGLGYSPAFGAAMLSLLAIVSAVFGPMVGRLTAKYPMRRSNIVLTEVALSAAAWGLVLAWPGVAPKWVVIVLVCVLAINGPASMVSFDFARTFNPASRLGSASGIVNTAGYIACLITIWGVGFVLEVRGGEFSLENFRLAFCVQYAVWGLGVAMLLWTRRRTRKVHGAPDDRFHHAVIRRLRGR